MSRGGYNIRTPYPPYDQQDRRPTTFRSCPGRPMHDETMVMNSKVHITFQMETNRPILDTRERDTALEYLRDDILQSLVNMHCPKLGQRNRNRPVGSYDIIPRSTSGLEMLSLAVPSQPTLEGSCSKVTHRDSLSCLIFSNDIELLFGTQYTTRTELETGVQETIQEFMDHGFYTDQVNLRLVENGSSLHVTGFHFENLQGVEPTTTTSNEGGGGTTGSDRQQPPFMDENNLSGFQQDATPPSSSDDGGGVNFGLIICSALVGFLGFLLIYMLWRRYGPSSIDRRFFEINQNKVLDDNGNNKNNNNRNAAATAAADGSLVTREETLTSDDNSTLRSGDYVGGGGNTKMRDGGISPSSDGYQPSAYFVEVGADHEQHVDMIVDEPMDDTYINKAPPTTAIHLPTIREQATSSGTSSGTGSGSTTTSSGGDDEKHSMAMMSIKCGNARCKACSKAPDNDPNYLCPNYAAPWEQQNTSITKGNDGGGKNGNRNGKEKYDPVYVSLRVFEDESNYHDRVDDDHHHNHRWHYEPKPTTGATTTGTALNNGGGNHGPNNNDMQSRSTASSNTTSSAVPPSRVNINRTRNSTTDGIGIGGISSYNGNATTPGRTTTRSSSSGAPPISSSYYGMPEGNSLLASTTTSGGFGEQQGSQHINKVVVIPPPSSTQGDPPFLYRNLRPARTVQL